MIKVFYVTTKVADFSGFMDAYLHWFVVDRKPCLFGSDGTLGIGYDEVIADYDAAAVYHRHSEEAVEELFTKDEADTFVAWARANRNGGDTMIREYALPVQNNIMPLGAIPVGGPQNFLMIDRSPDYNLPFKAWGYYDTRNCEFDAGSPGAKRAREQRAAAAKAAAEARQRAHREPLPPIDDDSFIPF
jgi:hypothetical protein